MVGIISFLVNSLNINPSVIFLPYSDDWPFYSFENYQVLPLNEKIAWCKRYSNNNADYLIVEIIIIIIFIYLKFIVWSGLGNLRIFFLVLGDREHDRKRLITV